jgi:hypothetical protein
VSIQAITAVFERSKATGNARLVMISIANHIGEHDGQMIAWPSRQRIAHESRCSLSTVKRTISDLVEMGELVIVAPGGNGTEKRANVYALGPFFQGGQNEPLDISQGVTGEPLTVGQDLATLGLDLEDLPSERSSRSSSTATQQVANEMDSCSGRLCSHLRAKIIANGCKPPTITKAWLDAARRLVEIDGRSEEQVMACIEWATGHEFWKANILSMPKLRQRYDQLRLQAQRERTPRMSNEYEAAIASLREARERVTA